MCGKVCLRLSFERADRFERKFVACCNYPFIENEISLAHTVGSIFPKVEKGERMIFAILGTLIPRKREEEEILKNREHRVDLNKF